MRILIINPNSSLETTSSIQNTAEDFVRGQFEVVCQPTPNAPEFIETYEDIVRTAPGMTQIVRDGESQYDAFIVTCHYDPNLDAIKEITRKPVVGIGEASMRVASMLGHRFSIITTSKHSIPIHEDLVRKYHLQNMFASIRAPGETKKAISEEEKYLELSRLALAEDMAEVIVLGCAGMSGLDKYIQDKLDVPVLDGIVCAMIIAAGLVKYGVSTSKIRKYNPVY
jgi:allantoin racemase